MSGTAALYFEATSMIIKTGCRSAHARGQGDQPVGNPYRRNRSARDVLWPGAVQDLPEGLLQQPVSDGRHAEDRDLGLDSCAQFIDGDRAGWSVNRSISPAPPRGQSPLSVNISAANNGKHSDRFVLSVRSVLSHSSEASRCRRKSWP